MSTAAQQLSQPARRARPFRRVRRALCRRNADAAGPRSRDANIAPRRPTRPSPREFDDLLTHYVGRPSPLYYAERLTEELRKDAAAGKGAQIWFKRDELNHTGAHKINNCIGQILLAHAAWARRGSSPRPARASTASPPRPSARASACPASSTWARRDVERQQPNVFRMKLLGAEVMPVTAARGR